MATAADVIKALQELSVEDRESVAATMGVQPVSDLEPPGSKSGVNVVKQEGSGGAAAAGSAGANAQVAPLQAGTSAAPVPRVGTFSGEEGRASEISFSQWKFEVRALQGDGLYQDGVILQAVRRSLRGRASDIVLRLGHKAKVEAILAKLEQIFGNVLPAENVLELFYVARQEGRESVAAWACRIEDLLAQLREKKAIAAEAEESMLRTKFYSGLNRLATRNAVRHRFDGECTYAELLVAARVAELETPARSHQAVVEESQMSILVKSMEAMATRLDQLEQKCERGQVVQSQSPVNDGQPYQFRGQCYGCGQVGHQVARCPFPLNGRAGLTSASQPAARR